MPTSWTQITPNPSSTASENLLARALPSEDERGTVAGESTGGSRGSAAPPTPPHSERATPGVPTGPAIHPIEDWGSDPADADSMPGSSGEHMLQCAFGSTERAKRFYDDQVSDVLNDTMIEFIGRMELAFLATADARGATDCSLRAGPAGFLEVLDQHTIAYPEYRGNGVRASLGNISENPHVGIMLIDFVRDLIGLHVNGTARIMADAELRAEHRGLVGDHTRGGRPECWVVVHVVEAYIHCRKHIPQLVPVERRRGWGTDDVRRKGGDYFGVRAARRAVLDSAG